MLGAYNDMGVGQRGANRSPVALRKKGITEKHYLNPLTVDDGRP